MCYTSHVFMILCLSICTGNLTMPLRDAADIAEIFIGSSANYDILHQDKQYAKVLREQYSLITAESGCKWKPTEPAYNTFNFTQCDYIYHTAVQNNQTFRGHNLCWNNIHTNPSWLVHQNWTQQQLIQILQNHITVVMQHYMRNNTRGVYAWDVVNEAVNSEPSKDGLYNTGVWYPAIPNYVEIAFQTARKVDLDTKLFYNDELIFSDALQFKDKSDAVYNMIKDMKQRNIPIDGIGFECHMNIGSQYPLNYTAILDNFQRYAALGMEIHITEMTVSCGRKERFRIKPVPCKEFTEQLETEQAEMYQMLVRACMETRPFCKSMETWSYTDKYTFYGSDNYPLPWDIDFQPKKAAYWIEQELLNSTVRF
eukprot:233007_1